VSLPEAIDVPGAGFRLGRTPVTNAQYAPFVATGRVPAPPWWLDPAYCAPDQPVVGVTWFEVARLRGVAL
jgi:formylglycine-generating enzyme required for sulfatase activity